MRVYIRRALILCIPLGSYFGTLLLLNGRRSVGAAMVIAALALFVTLFPYGHGVDGSES